MTADADLEFTYEALKVYLMLGSEDHYDAAAIKAWIAIDWESRLYSELGDDGFRRLTEHLDALLEVRPTPLPTPINTQLVKPARQKLERVSLEERIYARLKSARAQRPAQIQRAMRRAARCAWYSPESVVSLSPAASRRCSRVTAMIVPWERRQRGNDP